MNNRVTFTLIFFFLTFFAQAQFEELQTSVRSVYQGSVQWCDFDNDEKLDLLILGWDGLAKKRITEVYKNKGNGFQEIDVNMDGVNSMISNNVVLGDFNNDTRIDVILSGQNGIERITKLYQNMGNFYFKEVITTMPGVYGGSLDWGDYDNDGLMDLLLSGEDNEKNELLIVFKNMDAKGTFQDIHAPLEGLYNGELAWGDMNNDGLLDIISTGRNKSKQTVSKIYRNTGETFVDTGAQLVGLYKSAVSWVDFNYDGFEDVVISGSTEEEIPVIKLYENDKRGGFFENNRIKFEALTSSDMEWADYDNDGKMDVVMCGLDINRKRRTILYKNNGNGDFKEVENNFIQVDIGALAWGDYDADGRLDIVVSGQDDGFKVQTKVYKNNTPIANTAPVPPKNLKAVTNQSTVKLSWDRAEDQGEATTQTPAEDLTYNVYIGTKSKHGDIMGSMAHMKLGFKRTAGPGNVHSALEIDLKDLKPGTYYWGVQTIDNGFMPSLFSEEQTFEIK